MKSIDSNPEMVIERTAPYPDGIDKSRAGRWFVATTPAGRAVGVVWSDDENGFGFLPVDTDVTPDADPAVEAFHVLARVASDSGRTAYGAFEAARVYSLYPAGEVQSGKLAGALESYEQLNSGALTAAASSATAFPNGKSSPTPGDTLAVTADDDGNVLALIFSDETDVYIRESGEWRPIAENGDTRVDDREWVDVSPEFVEIFDSEASNGLEMTTDELGDYRMR